MHLNADISSALQLLEDIKHKVDDLGDAKLQVNTYQDLNLLISVLENPVFRSIVTVQDSLSELNQQLGQHPSILPVDFDIPPSGELILNVPPAGDYDHDYADEYPATRDFDEQRVPSAPISPCSPQVHTFNSTETKLALLNGKSLNGSICNKETLRHLQNQGYNSPDEDIIHRSPSVGSDTSKTGSDSIISSEWSQVESIDLINDGTGLGFGIVGMKNMGVVVKTILPGGVADRDGRLQSGDHILQIGDVNLHEMGSEQVATVLRQSGTHVRLVVARPVDITSTDYKYLGSSAPLVPTRLLSDATELDKYLVQHKYVPMFVKSIEPITDISMYQFDQTKPKSYVGLARVPASPSLPLLNLDLSVKIPEMEKFVVELKKDANGLGITIAGYVCEKEELSGIFVKSVNKGSAADLSGKIKVNDRIVEVDGQSLQGYSNIQAVEVLRNCGSVVRLCLERYLHGPKYEQLQQAIAASEIKPSMSPSPPEVPRFPSSEDYFGRSSGLGSMESKFSSFPRSLDNIDNSPKLTEKEIIAKWQKIVGHETKIIVAYLKKFGERSGLGISLEGTVDVEDGKEVRPHHYIRSILPEGPVGKSGSLKSGDELLEVNGHKLLGMNHHEVVSILKDLPVNVCMVCGRSPLNLFEQRNGSHDSLFAERSVLSRSLHNLVPATDRLVKAKSDGSLASSISALNNSDSNFNKMKSRSLEPLTGLAMWSSEPQVIELMKGERGLGFSILDYQDPIDPNNTVIVIRSLVPGGVAQLDGRLIPGDRLLFVNDTVLKNASLDQAVQALKGAPKGIVRIGVAKPLPLPDSLSHSSVLEVDQRFAQSVQG
ncbi:patj homolog [Harmonia axyridis]|uniref:patj homolog n=1 Tax=Harmonia axyridis TaxID=115357 RepID=UPI001E2796FF|nr:patj homolog [Harmonia axyridis]